MKNLDSGKIVEKALRIKNDDESYWSLVGLLHERGGQNELDIALKMLSSNEVNKREIGIDILAQLGVEEGRFQKEAGQSLQKALFDDVKNVRLAAIYALADRMDTKAEKSLLKFLNNKDKDFRLALIYALPVMGSDDALDALIDLSEDKIKEVRAAATFAIATEWQGQEEEVCEILEDFLEDDLCDVRGEALLGLALRESDIAMEAIRSELLGGSLNELILEAAEVCGSDKLLYALNEWRSELTGPEDQDMLELLEKAVESCSA